MNAANVVNEVTDIAFEALLKVYAILLFGFPRNCLIALLYVHASKNTKISSAAIPITIKISKVCKNPKYVTPNTPLVIQTVTGKLETIMMLPQQERQQLFKEQSIITNTKASESKA